MIGPKCIHCKKQLHYHAVKSNACPVGKRRRSLGFVSYQEFHTTQAFEAKEKSKGGAAESRKDREVRRAVNSNPCCACGTRGTDWNPVDPAHIRTFKVTQSDHPANMIPLCRECHRLQHSEGWAYMLSAFPGVYRTIHALGWSIALDPFQPGRFIFSHPEIA